MCVLFRESLGLGECRSGGQPEVEGAGEKQRLGIRGGTGALSFFLYSPRLHIIPSVKVEHVHC